MSFLERSDLVSWWYILYLKFLRLIKLDWSVHSVYLPENENIGEPENISMARRLIKY